MVVMKIFDLLRLVGCERNRHEKKHLLPENIEQMSSELVDNDRLKPSVVTEKRRKPTLMVTPLYIEGEKYVPMTI